MGPVIPHPVLDAGSVYFVGGKDTGLAGHARCGDLTAGASQVGQATFYIDLQTKGQQGDIEGESFERQPSHRTAGPGDVPFCCAAVRR